MARVLMKGCEAIAEAAVRAGCRFFAGYPITPQNEIPEYFARRLPEVGGNFVQGESEVASVNMVYGAAAAGTRSMTSSSSPGIALKSEGISYCAAARVPIVYSNISRGGPGVPLPGYPSCTAMLPGEVRGSGPSSRHSRITSRLQKLPVTVVSV